MAEKTVMLKRCLECGSANEPDVATCDACGHGEFQNPEPARTDLECDHCGDVAVESPMGIFHEDMADKCASCGFPGQVHVSEGDAYWSSQDDWHVRCENGECAECISADRDEVEYLRELVVATLPILEDYVAPVMSVPKEQCAEAAKLRKEILGRYGFMYAGTKP